MKYDVLEEVLQELYEKLSDEEMRDLTRRQLRLIKIMSNDVSSQDVVKFVNSPFFKDEIATHVLGSVKSLSKFEVSALASHNIYSLKNANNVIFADSRPDLKKARYYYVASGVLNRGYLKSNGPLSSDNLKNIIDKLYEGNDSNYYKVQLLSLPISYSQDDLDKIINTHFSEEDFSLIMKSFYYLNGIDNNLTKKYLKTLINDIISNKNYRNSLEQDKNVCLSALPIDADCYRTISRRKRAMEAIMRCNTIPEIKETIFAALNNGIYRSRAWKYVVSADNSFKKRNMRHIATINKLRKDPKFLDYYSNLDVDKQEEYFYDYLDKENNTYWEDYRKRLDENTNELEQEVNKFFKGNVSKDKVKKLIKTFKDKPYDHEKTTI